MTIAAGVEETIEVTSFAEVAEALRSPKLAVVLDDDSRAIRGGTVLRLDGDAHTKRRRLLNRLVLRDRHAVLRETTLLPGLERELARLPDEHVDLVVLCTRVLVETVAAMIGLDHDERRLDDLVRLHGQLVEFPKLQTQLRAAAPPLPEGDASRRAAIAHHDSAKRELVERHYGPALRARQERIARGEEDLPNDLLTIVALHLDSDFEADADLPVRHAVIDLLHAGTGTSVGAVVHTIDELERHFRARPDDRERCTDTAFLVNAVYEALRLHSANPAEVRRATDGLTLSGGTTIKRGQYVALRTGHAARDRSIFGADAERFDPWRTVPHGVNRYGLAFGGGPHMCFGVPLALGNEGSDGNLVRLVRRLYEAGVRPDPDRPARLRPGVAFADLKNFESYSALLGWPPRTIES